MPTAQINGTAIHYHVKGTGTPIVFIHPPLMNSANFNYQNVQLSDEYTVVTFDIRGHGHSLPSKQPITYPQIVEDMKQLMDFLHIDKAYVCGYSTGGSIALEAMLTYPDRFLGGIVLSGLSEVSDWWLKTRISLAVAAAAIKAKNAITVSIALGNADSRTTFTNLYKDAKPGNVMNWKQYYQYSLVYNCTAKLGSIKAPVLLIYGQKDTTFHRYAKILQKGLPNNELHFIPGLRHQLPTKAALQMNELIRHWVQRQEHGNVVPESEYSYVPEPAAIEQGVLAEHGSPAQDELRT